VAPVEELWFFDALLLVDWAWTTTGARLKPKLRTPTAKTALKTALTVESAKVKDRNVLIGIV
jgi:hypothetical protein